MPVSLLQSFVFGNTTQAGVKNLLLQYALSHPTEAAAYDLTANNINTLFYFYEYEKE